MGTKGHHHHHQQQLKTTEDMLDNFDDQELEDLYSWVDEMPLSRPKKSIARDFSDGVCVAEILKNIFPQHVELHNYTPASNTSRKTDNWNLLNKKVFKKMNFELADEVIHDVCCCKPGVIEKVLMMLRVKINRAKFEEEKERRESQRGGGRRENDKPEADQFMDSPGRKGRKGFDGKVVKVMLEDKRGPARKENPGEVYVIADAEFGALVTHKYLEQRGWNSGFRRSNRRQHCRNHDDVYDDDGDSRVEAYPHIPKAKVVQSFAEKDLVPRVVLEEREQECLAKEETIKILNAKVRRLEHLLHLKDIRIDDLQSRLESSRPTGLKR